jgi:hypothetical protein
MAATFSFYANGRKKLWNGGIDLDTDTLKVALTTSSYTANLDTNTFFSDLTNEITGTGYTAGGVTVTTPTITVTAANSWSPTWAASTPYAVGDVVKPLTPNGHLYRCVTAGTSGGSAPSWPTGHGLNVTDNTAVWVEIGTNIVVFDCDDPAWASSTLTAAYGVLYKSTGTAGTSPLIGILSFGGNISSTAAAFTITVSSNGLFYC